MQAVKVEVIEIASIRAISILMRDLRYPAFAGAFGTKIFVGVNA